MILDAFSRRVIGWAPKHQVEEELTLTALRMALSRRSIQPGLVNPSDRGSQFQAGKNADGVVCLPRSELYGYNSHEGTQMRSVNVAELKNQLSKYLTFAKGGEEIVIRDRSLPVAKLVPFESEDADEEELLLVAAGKMRLPEKAVDLRKVLKLPTGRDHGRAVTEALIEEREHGR